ncbi:hypothetical protein BGZ60DRAFT_424709 [Tricladium varicosporioides]|nr:hypothetical protein BGZ60DRAFT_424709 [Hymenoscyphus varicosporioides]
MNTTSQTQDCATPDNIPWNTNPSILTTHPLLYQWPLLLFDNRNSPTFIPITRMPHETLFPHLTATSPSPHFHSVFLTYQQKFDELVAKGELRPLVLPYHIYGYLGLMVYLCIDHRQRPWLYKARWGVLGLISWWQWKTLWEASSASMATSFAAGLIASYVWVWAWVWLVFYKPQWDARRVGRRVIKKSRVENGQASNGEAIQARVNDIAVESRSGNTDLRQRSQANGHAKDVGQVDKHTNGSTSRDEVELIEHYWQAYPSTIWERISWVTDLIVNFRGPGWNWAIPPLPSPPPAISRDLKIHVSKNNKSYIGLKSYNTRWELIRGRVPTFIAGYFALDILKIIMMLDPYFIFGPTTYTPLPPFNNLSHLQIRFVRQVISSFAIVISLEMVFILAPILLSLILGPAVIGMRGESWYYPTTWGSISNILDKGLNGLWGSWWHQTFRFAFSAPTNFLIREGYIHAKSMTTKLAALIFAFGISGILHSGGSISQLPRSYPWHAPIFFMLQALGIFIQSTICSLLHPQIKAIPRSIRRTGNLVYTVGWLFATGWWLTDDFARGGIWLWEPIPISLLRGLGFAGNEVSWWCWERLEVGIYRGKHWWETGIAI